MNVVWGLVIGAIAGILSGLFGIGGGIIVVPALVVLLGFSQHKAQGTSLAALVLPVGILGVIAYWKEKHVDLTAGMAIAIGLFATAPLGAKIAQNFDPLLMRKVFSLFLVVVAVYLWFKQ